MPPQDPPPGYSEPELPDNEGYSEPDLPDAPGIASDGYSEPDLPDAPGIASDGYSEPDLPDAPGIASDGYGTPDLPDSQGQSAGQAKQGQPQDRQATAQEQEPSRFQMKELGGEFIRGERENEATTVTMGGQEIEVHEKDWLREQTDASRARNGQAPVTDEVWKANVATTQYMNEQQRTDIEQIRDFVILHYTANGRTGEPFWDALRTMELPEPLANRIAMFRGDGRIVREHEELFDVPGWLQVMVGQGIVPERWHPLADQLDDAQLDQFLSTVATAFARDAARMPDHDDFVARLIATPQSQPQEVTRV